MGPDHGRRDPDRELVGLTDAVRAKVSHEISAGHKINAIKIYREATGAPLADAKSAVDNWFVPGHGPGVRDAASSWTEGRLTGEARSRISELVVAGRREDAMALYAEATGASAARRRPSSAPGTRPRTTEACHTTRAAPTRTRLPTSPDRTRQHPRTT